MDDALITIKDLVKIFTPSSPPAIDTINLKIPKGKLVGIVGPDGAGKTTLIRLLAGLLIPSSGSISIQGLDTVQNVEEIRRLLGYMPQKFGLYEDLSVMQNLNLYADIHNLSSGDREERFAKLLNFAGLSPFQKRLAGNLSGGMKQKLGLSCALLTKPALLLLDEPTVGVDPISRQSLWAMIEQSIHEGISVLWSTSYLDEADKCDLVMVFNEGKLLYYGKPSDLRETVKDRVYKITHIKEKKRELLQEVIRHDEIIDATVQGDNIRIVLKKDKDLSFLKQLGNLTCEKENPRVEDAFIDHLEHAPIKESVLIQVMPQIQASSDKIIQVNNLTKKFGKFIAVDNISFEVSRGEIFGLIGPNGAGKSTTFKMLCGLLKTTEGNANVSGIDLKQASGKVRSRIGYMAQKFSMYGDLSLKQNLEFFSGIYNVPRDRKNKIIQTAIDLFGFDPYLNVAAQLLPLGFKQRLALSCSIMHFPEILFLDEPTSGVDPITRREFWSHINGLVSKGVTIVVTTHFMEEAEYCDRIALMYKSKLIHLDKPEKIKELARTTENQDPTFEQAFIKLIKEYDENKK